MIAATGPQPVYTVAPGDTLSQIARDHNVSLSAVEALNPQIRNPDLIYPGGKVTLAGKHHTVVRGDTLAKIARANGVTLSAIKAANPQIANPDLIYPGEVVSLAGTGSYAPKHAAPPPKVSTSPSSAGHYSTAGLEALWVAAGGNPSKEAVAACIANAESGGNPNATGGVGERGLWQIHPVHGSLSTYSPSGNARAAVIISGNGTNWGPWTTHSKCGVLS